MAGERVQIVNPKHPHFPEHGVFTGETIRLRVSDAPMAKIKLDHCPHGMEACFVDPGDIEPEREAHAKERR